MQFEDLVRSISPALRGIVYKLRHRASFFNNEDLFQEAIIRLWLDYKDGKLANKTTSYILQGCYFHLKNYIRKNYDKANPVRLENGSGEEDGGLMLGKALSLEAPRSYVGLIDCRLLIERINNNGLTKREKEVFCLALDGLTTREIGSRLGISHVRVVKLKGRLRDKCRKYLNEP